MTKTGGWFASLSKIAVVAAMAGGVALLAYIGSLGRMAAKSSSRHPSRPWR